MKKFIALALSLILVLSLSVTAFAADVTIDNDTVTQGETTATGKYLGGSAASEVRSVDITWGNLQFQYKDKVYGNWQPDTHTYDNQTVEAHWVTNDDATITVVNHSNVEVTVNIVANNVENLGVDLNQTHGDDYVLNAGEENDVAGADYLTVKVTPKEGTKLTNANAVQAATLATITVTLVS